MVAHAQSYCKLLHFDLDASNPICNRRNYHSHCALCRYCLLKLGWRNVAHHMTHISAHGERRAEVGIKRHKHGSRMARMQPACKRKGMCFTPAPALRGLSRGRAAGLRTRTRRVCALQRTCRVCKHVYEQDENHARACRYHAAEWMGAERSKFYGRFVSEVHPGLRTRTGVEYFYDCCEARTFDAPGCCFGFHRSYDD